MLANIFGNLTSGLIRLAITAATLALIYVFLVKPVLETTEKVTAGSGNAVQQALDTVNQAFGEQTDGSVSVQIQKQIRTQLLGESGKRTGAIRSKRSRRLIRCIQRAEGDVNQIQRCAERLAP